MNTHHFRISPDVYKCLQHGFPVLALESAVITHGLPHPQNLELALELEEDTRRMQVTPATIGMIDGDVVVGLTKEEIQRLATETGTRKISRRDFGIAAQAGQCGGTTVAGTLAAACRSGIKVFATGGIGGVHRGNSLDVSADLPALGQSPVVVVCAGAKAILDLPATLEYLETNGVPVVGYQTDEFPAFYSRESGLSVTTSVDSPKAVAEIANVQWDMGIKSAVLVVQPPPEGSAIPRQEIESIIEAAVSEAKEKGIMGFAVTPFLLKRVSELSNGASLSTNLALLHNNVNLAAEIAKYLIIPKGNQVI